MAEVPPKRRGRPPIKAGEPSVPFHLRVSASDFDKADALARKNGVSIATIFRAAFRIVTRQERTHDQD